MSVKDFDIKSHDGLVLKCRTWTPAQGVTVRARVVFVHGFSEYIDLYDEWFPEFAKQGFETTTYDQRGHGGTAKTPKDYGVTSEAGVMGDLEAVASYVSKDYTGPLVLWGFSMGGAVVLNYMVLGKLRERFDLYISLGPFVAPHPTATTGLNGLKLKALPFLVRVFPNIVQGVDLRPELTTNDSTKWDLYHQQPKRHMRSSAALMNDALTRGQRLVDPAFLKNIVDKPLLVSQGEEDSVCDYSATRQFFELVKLSDKTLQGYPGLPHEVIQCVAEDRDQYRDDVLTWLNGHLPLSSSSAPRGS